MLASWAMLRVKIIHILKMKNERNLVSRSFMLASVSSEEILSGYMLAR